MLNSVAFSQTSPRKRLQAKVDEELRVLVVFGRYFAALAVIGIKVAATPARQINIAFAEPRRIQSALRYHSSNWQTGGAAIAAERHRFEVGDS